ncbi:MAG TPA: hypothetical protein VGJ60_03380 [Chloroflexota bacterium]|jgi:hypothetical protein
MLSYIILEKLSDEHQRELRAEADAERLWRASQGQPENRQARVAAAGSPSSWLRADGWWGARLLVRALHKSAA